MFSEQSRILLVFSAISLYATPSLYLHSNHFPFELLVKPMMVRHWRNLSQFCKLNRIIGAKRTKSEMTSVTEA
jgi:hypothetical protein